MDLAPLLFIVLGFVLLIKGADWLVEGASSFARRLGVSDLVIGLTIVSFGTSAPELIVNILASFKGSADIAIGNVVGSNISNTLLILGSTALITPLAIKRSTVFKEIPFCLLASIMLFVMANDTLMDGYSVSELGLGDGISFIGFFIIFLYYTFGIRKGGKAKKETEKQTAPTMAAWLASTLLVVGLLGLGAGGELVVRGAIEVARNFGLSEALIGLTIVALGTSLPELVTSIIAATKGKADIAVGNIIGSNIFNIFWILGISSIIRPLPFDPTVINTDLAVVIGSTVALFFFIHTGRTKNKLFAWRKKTGHSLDRFEGGLFLASYILYIAFISFRG